MVSPDYVLTMDPDQYGGEYHMQKEKCQVSSAQDKALSGSSLPLLPVQWQISLSNLLTFAYV